MPKVTPIRSDNEILNNIFILMKTKGIRQSDIADYLGISRNAISQWKINKSASYMNYIEKLADLFDVSPNELLHPDKSNLHTDLLSQDELEFITQYRLLKDDNLKKALMTVLASFIKCSKSSSTT